MLADWRKAGGLGSALKWFKVMASELMGKDDVGACHHPYLYLIIPFPL